MEAKHELAGRARWPFVNLLAPRCAWYPFSMANHGRGDVRLPAPAAFLLKAVLVACLPLLVYNGYKYGLYHLISTNPAAQFTYFGIAILYFVGSTPSRAESVMAIAGGVALVMFCPLAKPSEFTGEALVRVGAFVGIAGLVAMCFRAIVARDKDAAVDTLARSLIFVVLGIVLGSMLSAASAARPFKYDHFLYSIDVRFGTAISFAIGRWFQSWPPLWRFEIVIYHSLPFGLAVLYAAHLRRAKAGPVDVLTMMWVNAIAGYGLYFIYPAAGPLYAFGGNFPWSAPSTGQFALEMVRLNAAPNAMPSLHMACAILIWWNARGWQVGRVIAFTFMILIGFAAVGFGEHYFLDLVVAFPYALAIQAVATKGAHRWLPLALGAAMTAGWFLALLFAPRELAGLPVWTMWGLAGFTVIVPVAANWKMLPENPRAEVVPAPALELKVA